MSHESMPSLLEQLEQQAHERGWLLRLQVGRPLGLWTLRLWWHLRGRRAQHTCWGEMKGWAYGASNGLQLDTMRVVP